MWIIKVSGQFLLLVLVAIVSLSAQEATITSQSSVDQDTLLRWLHSSDPRLVAWAAYFARRQHHETLLSEMPALLEHWFVSPIDGGYEAPATQRLAIESVLDALIQENVQVPARVIDTIASPFSAQAAILIARQPLTVTRRTLEDWLLPSNASRGYGSLARIASMLLAKDPVPSMIIWNHEPMGFIASVVNASEDHLYVSVRAARLEVNGTGWGGCGDSPGHQNAPGWPEIYTYSLDETRDEGDKENVVVELDGDRIFSQRRKEGAGWGSCGKGVEELDPATRHRLLAHWLNVNDREMLWQPTASFVIVWTTRAAYEEKLGKRVELERKKLDSSVNSLRERGFLRKDELAMPRLVVTITCDITPCPLR